eukprot:5563049-Pyramimonas_sp.AAC.1
MPEGGSEGVSLTPEGAIQDWRGWYGQVKTPRGLSTDYRRIWLFAPVASDSKPARAEMGRYGLMVWAHLGLDGLPQLLELGLLAPPP